MRLQERVAVLLALGVFLRLLRLRHRQSKAPRQQPDRFLKGHFFKELDELDDVAADAAAETMKHTAIGVEVKPRRLFTVKRTESFPFRPASLHRHAFLNDLHDVGVRLQIINKRRWKQSHVLLNSDAE